MGDHVHNNTCGCDHTNPNFDSQSLFKFINVNGVICLNEAVENSGRKVFKPHEERLSDTGFVESDDDPELLFTIPFTDNVKVTGIIISCADELSHPKSISLFKDRPFISFDSVENPDQTLELTTDPRGEVTYDLKPTRFSSLSHLSILVSANQGGLDTTRIDYIGLRGKFMSAHRKEATVNTVYEVSPSLIDSRIKSLASANQFVQ